MSYTIQNEAKKILWDVLISDEKLQHPQQIVEAAKMVTFNSPTNLSDPFMPTPCKMIESSSALYGLLACYASLISSHRYDISFQKCHVDTDRATLACTSVFLLKVAGENIFDASKGLSEKFREFDAGKTDIPYRKLATNIYKTLDNQYFQLHGSLNADTTLSMLGLSEDYLRLNTTNREEVLAIITNEVAKHDSVWLDTTVNEVHRQAGAICYKPEQFAQTEQGKALKSDGLWTIFTINNESLPCVPWPTSQDQNMRPLVGIKVVDLSWIIAGPTTTRLLAALGATVIRVSYSLKSEFDIFLLETNLGKYDIRIDLNTSEGKEEFMQILADADVILDSYRPGCIDKLGFGRQIIHEMAQKRGKGIIYARENCYGWTGPWSHRIGWQQISDCVTGVSWLQGNFLGLDEPVLPLLPNSDYQTGVVGAIAIMQALYMRTNKGGSYNVDVSLNQFNMWYIALGQYSDEQRINIMAKHPNLRLRHTDEMTSIVPKTIMTLVKTVGKIFGPQNFETISSPKWDLANTGKPVPITFLASVITFDKTILSYDVGSCPPGSYDSNIRWMAN